MTSHYFYNIQFGCVLVDVLYLYRKRENMIMDNVRSENEMTVIGIVSSNGSWNGKLGSDELWSFGFKLCNWIDLDGSIRNDENRFVKKIEHKYLRENMESIDAETVVNVTYRIDEQTETNVPMVVEIVKDIDFKLVEILKNMKKEISFVNDVFGKVTYSRSLDWFDATIDWCGKKTELVIRTQLIDNAKEMLDIFIENYPSFGELDIDAKQYAGKKLIDLRNCEWSDGEDDQITLNEFEECMFLETLSIDSITDFGLWYRDGGIFQGHGITVEACYSEGFVSASI